MPEEAPLQDLVGPATDGTPGPVAHGPRDTTLGNVEADVLALFVAGFVRCDLVEEPIYHEDKVFLRPHLPTAER